MKSKRSIWIVENLACFNSSVKEAIEEHIEEEFNIRLVDPKLFLKEEGECHVLLVDSLLYKPYALEIIESLKQRMPGIGILILASAKQSSSEILDIFRIDYCVRKPLQVVGFIQEFRRLLKSLELKKL